MSRRWGLVALGIVLIAGGMGVAVLQRDGTLSRRPARNLILISIDTLRADHLSGYGYERPTSPRLDAFAARGVTFLNAISSSSWTVPAHMTLFTGLEPVAHRLIDYPAVGRLGSGYVTAAQILKERGFRTAAFTGGGFLSTRHGFGIGFDTFTSRGRRFENNLPHAREWLEAIQPGERFFLFLHGFNTHKPYKPPPPHDRAFCPDYDGDYDTEDLQPENPRPSPIDLDYAICQYDGEITYVDALLGDLLDELESKGLLEETLVVITSDHGDEMYEHGMVDHIHTLYDELVRVPLIIVGAGLPSEVVRNQVGQIDVFDSIFELLGLRDVRLGQSAGVLAGVYDSDVSDRSSSASIDESDAVYSFTGFSQYPYHLSSVRTDRWKLVLWSLAGMRDVHLDDGSNRPAMPSNGQPRNHPGVSLNIRSERERYTYKFRDRAEDFVELFDLRQDPGEQKDVAAEFPQVVSRLAEMLRRRIGESLAFVQDAGTLPAPGPEYLEAIRSLGYTAGQVDADAGPGSDSE